MIVTTKEDKGAPLEQNPYEAFATLLAELEAEGFFAQIDSAMLSNDQCQPWLQCHFIV